MSMDWFLFYSLIPFIGLHPREDIQTVQIQQLSIIWGGLYGHAIHCWSKY